MSKQTYEVWNGEYWTFEQIVENLGKLVRSIVARTNPEECIDDCMQDAWLRLYERLEADPEALGPDPKSKSPQHTRSFYANRVVWDAHKGSGFGQATQTYRSLIWRSNIFLESALLNFLVMTPVYPAMLGNSHFSYNLLGRDFPDLLTLQDTRQLIREAG
jgi:hypothetical protein